MLVDKIKELAKSRGKSMKQVALDLGLPYNTFYKWNKQTPKIDKIKVVADYFGVSIDYLLGNEEANTQQGIDLEKMLDEAMTFSGKPLSEHDREVVRNLVEAYLNSKKMIRIMISIQGVDFFERRT